MMKRRIIILILFAIFLQQSVYGQIEYYENPGGKADTVKSGRKLKFGFDFGLAFGYATVGRLSLQTVYPLADWNSIGLGVDGIYSKVRGYNADFIYGAKVFDEFYIFRNIIIHTEYQELYQPDYLRGGKIWQSYIYAGPGYKQPVSKNSYITYLLLWNFNINDNSIVSNPDIRICFYF